MVAGGTKKLSPQDFPAPLNALAHNTRLERDHEHTFSSVEKCRRHDNRHSEHAHRDDPKFAPDRLHNVDLLFNFYRTTVPTSRCLNYASVLFLFVEHDVSLGKSYVIPRQYAYKVVI